MALKGNNKNGNDRRRGFFGLLPTTGQYARKLVIGAVAVVALALTVSGRFVPERVTWNVNDMADRKIVAQRSVSYEDTEATQEAREAKRREVMTGGKVYDRNTNSVTDVKRSVVRIFSAARTVRNDDRLGTEAQKKAALSDQLDIELSDAAISALISCDASTLEALESTVTNLVSAKMAQDIRNDTDDLKRVREGIAKQAAGFTEYKKRYRDLIAEIAQKTVRVNATYDAEATQEKVEAALEKVPKVIRTISVGDTIIRPGEVVSQRHIDEFTALGLREPNLDYGRALSTAGVLVVLIGVLGLYIRNYRPTIYNDDRLLLLLAGIIVVALVAFKFSRGTGIYEDVALLCVTSAGMVIALLLDVELAMLAVCVIGLLIGIVTAANELRLVVLSIPAGLVAVVAVRNIAQRTQIVLRTGAVLAASNTALVMMTDSVFAQSISPVSLLVAAAFGLVSTLIALAALSVFQNVLDITTDLRLLELQNPAEPALQRLIVEAPGTYHHSVIVGNLAEAAARAIGANALLTRTACYYHDIGKLKRPYFFIENQQGAPNPHDSLSPYLSALVIQSHVKDGLEMAREIHLPKVVRDIIAEHHGTTLLAQFYKRALEEAGSEEVSEQSFRYPGPKPKSKEAAIVMLADSVEAAVRSQPEKSEQRVAAVVSKIIDNRLADGQLDESALTFGDINEIKRTFNSILQGIFHRRIEYSEEIQAVTGGQPADGSAYSEATAVGGGDGRAAPGSDDHPREGKSETGRRAKRVVDK